MSGAEVLASYLEIVRELSERLVAAQQPIRVLNAIAWDDSIRSEFFAAGCDREPIVDADYYRGRPLSFDPIETTRAFRQLHDDVEARLGESDPAALILMRMCREYDHVIEMLEARGTAAFSALSSELYGRTSDAFFPGQGNLADLADILDETLTSVDQSTFVNSDAKDIPTEQAVAMLQDSLDRTMQVDGMGVQVRVDDGIVADAAAGSDYIKLRKGVRFSRRDLALLEAHEGWVHVGTTLNGLAQPYCTFLGKGTPATTTTQEGLAVLVEVTSLRSHPARLRRITDRIHGIALAEDGASFLEVFRAFVDRGRTESEAWSLTSRIYRGSLPTAGPFAKDLSYSKGFVMIYNFLRIAIRRGRLDRIPLLFVGKLVLEEIGLIADLVERGVVSAPRFLPPVFADPSALVSWMAFSNFLNGIDLSRAEASFADLLD